MNIELRRFDPRTIKDATICLFIGKRGTGKTTLMEDILYYKRHIPTGVVMSATEESNATWGKHVPGLFVHNDYKPDLLKSVIKKQRRKLHEDGDADATFVVAEDCMYQAKTFSSDKGVKGLFFNGRHWRIFVMISSQYCLDLPPALRANVDYVFCCRENILHNRERLYKNFFGILPNFDCFSDLMNACTQEYEVLVLDQTSTSNNISDCIFFYKAKHNREFKVGSKDYWMAHHLNYKKEELVFSDDEEGDAKVVRTRKKR
jgi:hypothetical protein